MALKSRVNARMNVCLPKCGDEREESTSKDSVRANKLGVGGVVCRAIERRDSSRLVTVVRSRCRKIQLLPSLNVEGRRRLKGVANAISTVNYCSRRRKSMEVNRRRRRRKKGIRHRPALVLSLSHSTEYAQRRKKIECQVHANDTPVVHTCVRAREKATVKIECSIE